MLLLILLALTQGRDTEAFGNFSLPYEADYVGSASCGACHGELIAQQQSHHMAQTGRPASPGDPLFSRDSPNAQLATGVQEMIPTAEDVTAIIGSGVHGVTPIVAAPERAIREHPLTYSTIRNEWFPTPGPQGTLDPLGSLKSPEESRECLSCHATSVSWNNDILDAAGSTFGVQCERCHGPGSRHIDVAANGVDNGSDWSILNPQRLSRDAQVAFCAQCHRQPIDFEPLDVMTRAPTLARHAGVGLAMSRCFRESLRTQALTCTECHSPHRNMAETDALRYRQTCLRCHTDPASSHTYERVSTESDCIGCHMPEESEAFYGLTFTDHWIRTPGSSPPLGSVHERRTLDYLELLYRNAWELDTAGAERRSRLALGFAEILFGLERREGALDWARDSLGYAPTTAQRLKAAAMLREGGELDGAEEVLRIAVGRDPELLRGYFDLGSIAAQRGRHQEALPHYERALAIRNDFGEGHLGLATSLRQLNQLDAALDHYREANRLAPNNPAVLEGMAWVLATHPVAASRSAQRALQLAEEAAAATGYRNPVVLDTLGAAYAASGDFETAANAARKAVALAEAAGATKITSGMRLRLALYESGAAYVSPRR